jgi:hypothetical protein
MEVSGQLHAPAALPQGKSPWYLSDRADLDAASKRKVPIPRQESNSDHPIVKPVASYYTD